MAGGKVTTSRELKASQFVYVDRFNSAVWMNLHENKSLFKLNGKEA